MNKEKKKYSVTIFGDHYGLISDEPFELVMKVSSIVDSAMQEIAQGSQISDPKRIAVLAALQVAEKLVALEVASQEGKRRQEELLGRIDRECSSVNFP